MRWCHVSEKCWRTPQHTVLPCVHLHVQVCDRQARWTVLSTVLVRHRRHQVDIAGDTSRSEDRADFFMRYEYVQGVSRGCGKHVDQDASIKDRSIPRRPRTSHCGCDRIHKRQSINCIAMTCRGMLVAGSTPAQACPQASRSTGRSCGIVCASAVSAARVSALVLWHLPLILCACTTPWKTTYGTTQVC